ncbi:MAG: hypothetical protein AB7J13_00220 [Pyrinomonadaceae bacterium]
MKSVKFVACLSLVSLSLSCGANEQILKSGTETPAPTTAVSTKPPFERELDEIETASFTFLYVLRRKDGRTFDAADRQVIRLNTADVNRRISADNDRAFIIGSNYAIPPENLAALANHFAIEDRSPPPAPANNSNSNANG